MHNNINSSIWEKKDPRLHMRYDDRCFAMGTSRRFFLGLALYILVSNLFMFITGILLALFAPDIYKIIEESSALNMILGSVAIYLVGTFVLYLTVKGCGVRKREKTNLSIENIIILCFICQFFAIAGNLIGQLITLIMNTISKTDTSVSVDELLSELPLWCIFLVMVIAAPVFEELVFRKLMIDRFGIYGDKLAIIVSAITFGLFHGNFGQFFYTAAVGLVWGYVYAKSGRLRYSVIMHMIMNFVGGFLPSYALSAPSFLSIFSIFSFVTLQYGTAIAGFVLLIVAIAKKWYILKSEPEVYIPKKHLPRFLVFNVGSLLFLIIIICEFAINHFPAILENLVGISG